MLYSIRSERLLVEELDYSVLYRCGKRLRWKRRLPRKAQSLLGRIDVWPHLIRRSLYGHTRKADPHPRTQVDAE
jgi:hypothetical protein